jgi:predicted phosphodiesterase
VARLLAALTTLALALGGVWLGVRLAQPGEYETPLGRVSVALDQARHGEIAAYVPLADWGVRARPFDAPVAVRIEPRTLEREAALRAAEGERSLLRRTEADLRSAIERAALRTLRYALGGAAAMAVVLALLLAARGERRPGVLAGLPALVVGWAILACVATLARASATFDEAALARPTYFARGAELVQLVDAAENARQAGQSYALKVEGAVRGFATLLSDPTTGDVEEGRSALLVSDVHDNRFALESLRDYARGKPVFFAGDLGNTGGRAETALLAPRLARLGSRVIAVSGNHDSSRLMRSLARRGATVLHRRGVLRRDGTHGPRSVRVEGLRVAGFDDPNEWRGRRADDPRRVFSFAEMFDPKAAEARARADLLRWFDGLRPRPDVVMLHQNGLALFLARTLQERGVLRPLTILTGHDHRQHVDRYGPHVVVNGGTAGAGGLAGVGQDSVGLAELHFAPAVGELEAADLIAIEPVSGNGLARRVVNRGCDTADRRCRLSAPQYFASAGPAARPR